MTTWSIQILHLLHGGVVAPLQQAPFEPHVPTAILNIGRVVNQMDRTAGQDLRVITKGGELDIAALTAFSDRVRRVPEKHVGRIYSWLDKQLDQIPEREGDQIDRLVTDLLVAGKAAFEPRSFEAGGSALKAPAAPFSELVHGGFGNFQNGEPDNILDRGVELLISGEVHGRALRAGQIEEMAKSLVETVRAKREELLKALSDFQKEAIRRIADNNGISRETAEIEYLANVCLFKVLRDFYDLQKVSSVPVESTAGFIVLTNNGSIVGSPSDHNPSRTFHYSRMPSRHRTLLTDTYRGGLQREVLVGRGLRSEGLYTSPVAEIVLISPEKADIFERVLQTAVNTSSLISVASRLGGRE